MKCCRLFLTLSINQGAQGEDLHVSVVLVSAGFHGDLRHGGPTPLVLELGSKDSP